jgi:tetratricopeptide (TPR) repeat protein
MKRLRLSLFTLGLVMLSPLSQGWAASPQALEKAQAQTQVQTYSQEFSKNPENWQALLFRGNAYAKLGNHGAALRDYNYILERNPNYLDGYKRRGMLYEQMKQWDKAIDNYTSMIEMHPRNDLGYMLRADVFAKKAHYNQALDDYASAIRRNQKNGIAWFKRANIFYQHEDYKTALKEFQLASLAQPSLLGAYEKQAICAYKLGDMESYIYALSYILMINPENPKIHLYRAKALLKLNKPELAIDDLENAINQDKTLAEAYYLRSEFARSAQMCSQAKQDLLKACRLGYGQACKKTIKNCVEKPASTPAQPPSTQPASAAPATQPAAPAKAATPPASAAPSKPASDNLPPATRQAPPPAAKP